MRHNFTPAPIIEYPKWIYKDPAKFEGGVVAQDADEEASILRGWLADAEKDAATNGAPADAGASPESMADNSEAGEMPRRRGRPPKISTPVAP